MWFVLGAALRGRYSHLIVPPTLPFTFSDLRAIPGRADYEHVLAKYAIASLKALSGGDVAGLLDFITEKYPSKISIPQAAASPNPSMVVSALCSIQHHFVDFLDSAEMLDQDPTENNFQFEEIFFKRMYSESKIPFAL